MALPMQPRTQLFQQTLKFIMKRYALQVIDNILYQLIDVGIISTMNIQDLTLLFLEINKISTSLISRQLPKLISIYTNVSLSMTFYLQLMVKKPLENMLPLFMTLLTNSLLPREYLLKNLRSLKFLELETLQLSSMDLEKTKKYFILT